MNELVRAIVFYIFGPLNSAHTGYMTPFPAVFTLQHSGVHVCAINCTNEAANIESLIDETLGFGAALHISYSDDGHILLGKYLDNS